MSIFQKATKEQAKARIAFSGPSGSGKTFTSLLVAKTLAQGGKIAVLDTERGSASKYADLVDFDVVNLDTFSPDDYIAVINAAQAEGYDVLVIDSLSHSWAGKGGVLEIVDKETARSKSGNSYAAWRKGTPAYNKLVDAILGYNGHVIATMRAKSEYIIEDTGRGKAPKKIGLAPVNREGAEFEYDIFCEVDQEHRVIVSKSRCPALADGVFEKPGAEFAEMILAWLTNGSPAAPVVLPKFQPPVKPAPEPQAEAPAPKAAPKSAPKAKTSTPVDAVVKRMNAATTADELNGVVTAAKSLTLTAEDKQTLNAAYAAKLASL